MTVLEGSKVWTAVNFLLAILKPLAARGSVVGDIVGWLLGRTPSKTPRTVNPGTLATDARALASHAGGQVTGDTVNLLGLGLDKETAKTIIDANGGMPEKSSTLQEMAKVATEEARHAMEGVVDAVVDALPAHVTARLDGKPVLVQKAANLVVPRMTETAKQAVGMTLDRMEEQVRAAVAAAETEILSLESEMEQFGGKRGTSMDGFQLEVMEEAKGGVKKQLKQQLKVLLGAQVEFSGFNDGEEGGHQSNAVLKTLCGFKQDQTEADLGGMELGAVDAQLIAWDLVAGPFVSASMNKLNILGNSIGDEGYEMLMKLAEEKGMLTFCGFEEGQTEADLSKKNLGPVDAKLIARELTTGYVSSSMTSLK